MQYAYDDGIASNEAKYVRPDYVTYPGPSTRRKVYYHYSDSTAANESNWTAQEKIGQKLSRLRTIAAVDIDGSAIGADANATYTYLGAGTVVKVEYPAVTDTLALTYGGSGDGYSGFDRFGRVVDQKWQTQGETPEVKDRYTYGYDLTGNRLYRKNELKAELGELYHANGPSGQYDGLDRLTDFRRGALSDTNSDNVPDTVATVSRIQAWSLDPVGNWSTYKEDADGSGWDLDQARLHNKANEIEDTVNQTPDDISGTPNWIDPAYDTAGNMTAGPKPGAEAATTSNYTYDAWNRLVKVSDGETTVAEYRYDGRHRRIRKYTAPSGDNWTVQEYYYNESWQVLEVRKDTKTRTGGAEPALADTLHKQYVWGADYIDSPVVRFRDSSATPDGVLDETLYYTHDAQFNVTALVTAAGAVAERYMYAPYGQVTVLNGASGTDPDVTGDVHEWDADTGGSDYDNEILYCGYRFDPESGLYHVRHRPYHPTLGRWLTRDKIRYGDGMNLYQYVRSAPCVATDWSGRDSVITGLLGAIGSIPDLVRRLANITVDDFVIDFKSITVGHNMSFGWLSNNSAKPTGVMVVEINRKEEACPCGPDKEVGRKASEEYDQLKAIINGTLKLVKSWNVVIAPPEWYEVNPSLSITVYSPLEMLFFSTWTGSVELVEEEIVDCEGPDGPYSETIFRARTEYAGTFLSYEDIATIDEKTYGVSPLVAGIPLAPMLIIP